MADSAWNYNAPLSWPAKCHQPRGVAAGPDEVEKAGSGDGGGGAVVKRVAVEAVGLHHLGIEDHGDALRGVVDEGEGGDRSRLDAQDLAQELRPGKGEAGRADQLRQGLELD